MKKAQYLKELKDQVVKHYNIIVVNGGFVRYYKCPHCTMNILTNVPGNEIEVWDTMTTCYECGKFNYIVQKKDIVLAYKYLV